jgi:hypothetical protein
MTLTEQMKADGWIEHDGGPCPVEPETPVIVWLRGWFEPESQTADYRAGTYDWEHVPDDAGQDIIAYRPEQPQ